MKTNYNYQIQAAKEIHKMAKSGDFIASVLAGTPGCGKSTILIHILNLFYNESNYQTVVLTHNLNILKDQMIGDLTDGHVKLNTSCGDFSSEAKVKVGIHSAFEDSLKADILIIDEAHQYFHEKMVDSIIEKLNPKFIVLLTGSPGYFNKYNFLAPIAGEKEFGVVYIAQSDLVDNNVMSKSEIDVTLCDSKDITKRFQAAINKISLTNKENLEKLMVAVNTVKEANALKDYIRDRKVAISTSENDQENLEIEAFRKGEKDLLIVVNKGILGFSDNNITGLIDLKCSKNLESRNQIFARILRKHPFKNLTKLYLSVVETDTLGKEMELLSSLRDLAERENFVIYQGKC